MSGQIFISYRREDASYPAGRLYDRLSAHFPQNQIFIDVDTIEPGIDFVKALEESVGACDVLIAVIGKRWLTSCDQEGKRQLENPEDFVRIEIATALKRDIRVIPVLVENASMPRSGDLPDDLKSLVRRQALAVSHDRFRADSERLIGTLERALEKTTTERREREEKERLEAERRETEANERLESEQREKERLKAEQREMERLEREARQPSSPVAPSTSPPEADKLPIETLKGIYPSPREPEKPPPSSSAGTGGKPRPKQVNAFLAIAAILMVGGLIYLVIRRSQSPHHSTHADRSRDSKSSGNCHSER